jgi:pSer/pThr/pTyr-binding forkhead associated (FHA) protein
MEGTFNSGELLYYWYDLWAVAAALAVITILTISVLVRTSWIHVFPLVVKTITLASTVMVSVVALDRIGGNFNFSNPVLFGYTSVGAAGITALLGVITLVATRGGTPLTMGAITGSFNRTQLPPTPNARADFSEALGSRDAYQPVQGEPTGNHQGVQRANGGSQTLIMGGAGSRAHEIPAIYPADADVTIVQRSRKSNAWFIARKGSQAGQSFDLSGEQITLGRAPGSGVKLDDVGVSREHAAIQLKNGGYVLCDVGSTGGTLVNGKLLSGLQLKEGGSITVGASQLVFTTVEGTANAGSGGSGDTLIMRKESLGALLVRTGPAAGTSINVGLNDVAIGRDPGTSGAKIDDPEISRRHALIRRTGKGYSVFDLGSASGTVVDGVRVSGHELQNGDIVTLGETELQFVRAERS